MLSSNELSYEQEICNILKETKIHQRLEELKERTKVTGREHAFNVCSDSRVTEVIEGYDTGIDITKIHEKCNNKVDINIHSHPHSKPYPSDDDFIVTLNSQPRVASCIYSARDDSTTCYNISDEFRDKYKPFLDDAINKVNEIVIKHNNTKDPMKKIELMKEYIDASSRYEYLENKIKFTVMKDIYPDINSYVDYVNYIFNSNLKFGNFGDVWVKDCGKI